MTIVPTSRLAGPDGEVRWVGVTPPTFDEIAGVELMRDYVARLFADATIDGDEQMAEWRRGDYIEYRDRAARWRAINDRMDIVTNARYAGFIVREDIQL